MDIPRNAGDGDVAQKGDRAGPSSAHHRTGLAKVTESSDSGRGSLC